MKRVHLAARLSAALLPVALILSGCGGASARADFESFSKALAEEENLSYTARVRAEYDDSSVEFTLEYAEDTNGARVTVLSPEIIRGVSARVSAGETALEYDGVSLDTGELDDFGLSPMSALPRLTEAMKSGYLDTAWTEDGELCALIVPADGVSVQVRLDKYTNTPLSAELASNGRVRVFAEICEWSPTGKIIEEDFPNTQEDS